MNWLSFSLQRKLSFIMMISTMVPLLSLGTFTYVISSGVTEEKMKQSAIDTLGQMAGWLDFVINDVENMSIFLIGQRDIQEHLRAFEEVEQVKARILSLMTDLVISKKYISNISVYPHHLDSTLSTTTLYESDPATNFPFEDIHEKKWTELYEVKDYTGTRKVISYIRPIRDTFTFESLGWLMISLDEEVISKYWSEALLGEGRGEVALLNEHGIVLSSINESWLRQSFDSIYPDATKGLNKHAYGEMTFGKGKDKKSMLYYKAAATSWTIVGTLPYELHRLQNQYILMLTAVAILITILLNAFLVLFVIYKVTRPLSQLTRLITKIRPDEPLPYYHIASNDEIGRLGHSYNMLGTQIKLLKEQLIFDQTRKKEADMRALQAQINPHFLYNTLYSIHWMALMSGVQKIADMVSSLGNFLQFSLNKGKDYCQVRQEFEHLKNYAEIQKIRFPDKFNVDCVMDPEIEELFMLKLLLQPLVENAMIHGIQKKAGQGNIYILARKSNSVIHFQVLDDGIGMTQERLQKVREGLVQPNDNKGKIESYGLYNVTQRLQLHYGPGSALHIDSNLNEGTQITFSIPIKEVSDAPITRLGDSE